MTTNLLYIGKSKSFLTQFGKLEDVQLFMPKTIKMPLPFVSTLKRERILSSSMNRVT